METKDMSKTVAVVSGLIILVAVGGLMAQTGNVLPPAKQDIEQSYENDRTSGEENPAPKDPNAAYPTVPEPEFVQGILDYCSPPFSSQNATITSCWQGLQNGVRIAVYAGAAGDDPQQGILYALTMPDYPAEVSVRAVLSPVKGGALSILAEQNTQLLLISGGNDILLYDLNSGAFSSLVPSPTLLFSALNEAIRNFDLPTGIAQSLFAKIGAASLSLGRGNRDSARGQLGAFMNQVTAQRGKALTGVQADALLALSSAAFKGI
jgi:hypothetical protein